MIYSQRNEKPDKVIYHFQEYLRILPNQSDAAQIQSMIEAIESRVESWKIPSITWPKYDKSFVVLDLSQSDRLFLAFSDTMRSEHHHKLNKNKWLVTGVYDT